LFENGKSVMYMIFDGKNTNYMSWFSYTKFLESNYDDLYNDGCFYKFQFTKFVSIIYIPPQFPDFFPVKVKRCCSGFSIPPLFLYSYYICIVIIYV
jgi:hypothetical protein